MNKAIQIVNEKFNLGVREYTVTGEKYKSLFTHRRYICVENKMDPQRVGKALDDSLKQINDDYRTE